MAYVDYSDYQQYAASIDISEDDFATYAERATDIIDELTSYKLHKGVFEQLSDYDKSQVKRAVCAQMEHLYYQGIDTAFSGASSGSYSIGSTSVTGNTGSNGGGSVTRVSPLAKRMLIPTGLLYRGVDS